MSKIIVQGIPISNGLLKLHLVFKENITIKNNIMKKLATVLFASVLLLAANPTSANCGKKDCKDCKKETKAHKCDKKCMNDGKCAEIKKETPKAKTN